MFRRSRTAVSRPTNRINHLGKSRRFWVQPLEDRLAPAVWTVNDPGDAGAGTGNVGDLRYCVTNSVANDVINFSAAVFNVGSPPTISLGSTLAVNHNLSIDGTSAGGAAKVVVDGGGFVVPFTTAGSTNDIFTGLTIQGGAGSTGGSGGGGGAVSVTSTTTNVTLTGCIVQNNTSSTTGGVMSLPSGYAGTVTLNNCTFTGNTGPKASVLYFYTSGTCVISGSSFTGNVSTGYGGACYLYSGTTTITNSTFANNSGTYGGALELHSSGTLNMTNCSLTGNTGTTRGGAININSGGTANITGTTVSGNNSPIGGGINLVSGTLTFIDGTISGNTATGASGGGGLGLSGGTANIRNSTVVLNSASGGSGGGFWRSGATVTTSSSIIAKNTAFSGGQDGHSTAALTLAMNNSLIGIGNDGGITWNATGQQGTTATPLDPVIDTTLALNSAPAGSPFTHKLLTGSPALDLGNNSFALTVDQRGFPRVSGAAADVGSYELLQSPTVVLATGPSITNANLGQTSFVVTMRYVAANPMDTSTIDNTDLTVSNPFGLTATPLGTPTITINSPTDVTVQYGFTPPGGSWVLGDFGRYDIKLTGTVSDVGPPVKSAPTGTYGTFRANFGAKSLVVDNKATDTDDGNYSVGNFTLREAINYANFDAGNTDTITFSVVSPITLASNLPTLTNGLTVTGPGAGTLTIAGNSFQIFSSTAVAGTTLTVSDLTLSGAKAASGAAISMTAGNLAVTNMLFTGNSATSTGGAINVSTGTTTVGNSTFTLNTSTGAGAGIWLGSSGTLSVTSSIFTGNVAGGAGGGIYVNVSTGSATVSSSNFGDGTAPGQNKATNGGAIRSFGSLTINGGNFNNNSASSAGGAVNGSSTLTIAGAAFSNNTAGTNGGAINASGGTTIGTSTFTNNVASGASGLGGGINSSSTITINNSSLIGNSALGATAGAGGGLHWSGASGVTAKINSSTFSGNKSLLGGGINASSTGTITFSNSTMSGNVATGTSGGGGFNQASTGTLNIRNSTVVFNTASGTGATGGGFRRGSTGTIGVSSSIIAKNTSTTGGADGHSTVAGGVTIPLNNSLIGIGNNGNITFNGTGQQGTTGTPLDPVIDPTLALNSAPVGTPFTHALLAGSPALNQGNNADALAFDERGTASFPRIQGATADVGAFEAADPAPSATATAPNVTVPGGTTHTVTVVYTDVNGSLRIDSTTLKTGNIIVTGPNSFTATPTIGSIIGSGPNTGADYQTFTVQYTFTAPNNSVAGTWDASDNGVYTISSTGVAADQVKDKDTPTPFPLGVAPIGTFSATMPRVLVVNALTDTGAGSGNSGDLRYCITQANTDAVGPDTITFDPVLFASAKTITVGSELKISNSVFITGPGANLVTISGGGTVHAFNVDDATATKINVTISGLAVTGGNGTGGALSINGENLTLDGVWFYGNKSTTYGGAVYLVAVSNVTVLNSTLSGNSGASGGGAMYFRPGSAFIIRNSTIVNNTGNGSGGAVVGFSTSSGSILVQNTTITGNTSTGTGGAFRFTNASYSANILNVESSIISGNLGPAGSPDIYGYKVTTTNTILGSSTGIGAGGVNDLGGTLIGADPMFDPAGLANNGGPMSTIALLSGSPAINTGSNPASLTLDQRGAGFPRSQGGGVDMGAIEFDPSVPSASVTAVDITVISATPETITVVYSVGAGVIKASTLDGNDILVTGPNGYSKLGTLTGGPYADAGSVTVTYTVPPNAGGSSATDWDGGDSGVYSISMQPSQVTTGTGKAVAAGKLGSFKVDIANNYVVDAISDVDDGNYGPGQLSFREAVNRANAGPTVDTITFSPSVFASLQTIVQSTEIAITQPVTITGPAAGVVFDATGKAGVRLLNVDVAGSSDNTITISNMTFKGGSNGTGSIILNVNEDLSLTNVTVTGGTSSAAIYLQNVEADLTLESCSLTNNSSTSGGGAIRVQPSGALTVLTINNSTLSGNTSSGAGGSIYFNFNGTLTVSNSTFNNNKGSTGGAVALWTASATFTNTTFFGNTATGSGGAIALQSTGAVATLNQSTVVGNSAASGGGLAKTSYYASDFTAQNTIIARNSNTGNTSPDLYANGGGVLNGDYNLIGVADVGGMPPTGGFNLTGTQAVPLDPGITLGLGAYGGPTQTLSPLAGSPVIDAGDPSYVTSPTDYDQRGVGHPRVLNSIIDIGSVEGALPNPSGVLTPLGPIVTAGPTPNSLVVTYTAVTPAQIKGSSIDTGDITIKRGATSLVITGASPNINGSPLAVTYTFTPPGGAWDITDNGTYTVSLVGSQVQDTNGIFAIAGTLGTFQCGIDGVTLLVDEASDVDDGDYTVGKLSLREAINLSNGGPAADTINFSPAVFATAKTINVVTGDMTIASAVTINGPAAGLTLDAAGNAAKRIFTVDVPLSSGNAVDISNMTLQNGSSTLGSIIRDNDENLSLTNVTVTGGSVSAAVALDQTTANITVTGCTFSNNTGSGGSTGSGGAAIFITGASGNQDNVMTVTNSTFSGNAPTAGPGGAVYFYWGGKAIISGSTFNNNTTTGRGGAIESYNGSVEIQNSTFSGNIAAANGGAIDVFTSGTGQGPNTISNSTFTGNSSGASGGAIAITSTAATLQLDSTIVAGNAATTSGPDLFSSVGSFTTTGDNNLVGVADSGGVTLGGTSNLTGTLATPLNAKLGPLANNGGPTQTHALLAGSPAIDTGSNPLALATDQRGQARTFGSQTDIGAYELAAMPPTVLSVVINGANGAGNQRSMVESLVVTFSEAVNFTGAAFQLARIGNSTNNPGGLLGNVNLTVVESSPSATVTLKFATGGTVGVDPAGAGKFSLLDGKYQLTIVASGITGTGGNMAANYQTPTTGTGRIFRLYGDADGNGIVDGLDFGAFRTAFNTNSFTFDKDGSGVVDGLDFGQFRSEFNNSVP